MITADQILAHLVGDYILQSHWMATEKTKRNVAAAVHALTYALPFLLLTHNPAALAFIVGTHFAIDRFRLARYVVFFKNMLAPSDTWVPWRNCSGTGYQFEDKPYFGVKGPPAWLSVWLLIIADNTLHLICNGVALMVWP